MIGDGGNQRARQIVNWRNSEFLLYLKCVIKHEKEVSNRALTCLSSKRDGAEETAEGETFRGENGQNPSSSQMGHITGKEEQKITGVELI